MGEERVAGTVGFKVDGPEICGEQGPDIVLDQPLEDFS